jgi:hypothetical protein
MAPNKAQSTEHWLQQWEITYAEADKHKLAVTRDHRAVYNFMQAIKAIDPAYASAYQIAVYTLLADDTVGAPTLYDAVERFRKNLLLNRAT